MSFDPPIRIVKGPPEIADWPETARITRVEFARDNFYVRHTKEGAGPGAWPGIVPPDWQGPTQWTLYVVLNVEGVWTAAPCIIYWPEEPPRLGVWRGGDPAPFSSGARNWWYQAPPLTGHQPRPGERVGLIAVAGALRELDVRTVAERSNVAWVTVPDNDTGVINFAEPQPEQPPAPPPPPQEPPTPPPPQPPAPPIVTPQGLDTRVLAQLEAVTAGLTMACRGLLVISEAIQKALVTPPKKE